MPHCGVWSPIDVDGSFWDAVDAPEDPASFDGVPGSFRLTSSTEATFTVSHGGVLHLDSPLRQQDVPELPIARPPGATAVREVLADRWVGALSSHGRLPTAE